MAGTATEIVGRLAPSPTGAQHVGNARTYLLAWLSVRRHSGRVILRIEDIDSPRVKSWAVQQAIDDLRWLGLDWDEGPDVGGPNQPYVQTSRMELYQAALEQLKQLDLVYPCTCTRSDVAAAASAPHAGQEGPIYPGTCAKRSTREAQSLSVPFVWRLRTPPEIRTFDDRVAGTQQCNIGQQLGDFVVGRSDGTPAYQLAVVVDDHAMGVTEVLRGDDLLPSAFRQLELYRIFGWKPPTFAHVPLVVGSDGRRLAKRHGDTRLSLLRERGVKAETLVGYLAHSCGLRPTAEPVAASDLVAEFDLWRVPRQALVFSDDDLRRLLSTA